jgi:CMP-N-acetylneuraminic acid synthetase
VIAVIPVKTHSSRCPDKNFRLLGNKPLWRHTYEAAEHAGVVTRPYIIYDKYVKSRSYNIDHRIRPDELIEVESAVEVVRWFLDSMMIPDASVVAMMLPTSPFRRFPDVNKAHRLFQETRDLHRSAEVSVISVSPVRQASHKHRSATGWLAPTETLVRSNGAIQITTAYNLRRNGFHGPFTMSYMMDEESGLDIDTEGDWIEAERIYESRYGNAGLAGSDARQEPRQGAEGDPGLVEVHGKRWAWSPLHSGEVSTGATD